MSTREIIARAIAESDLGHDVWESELDTAQKNLYLDMTDAVITTLETLEPTHNMKLAYLYHDERTNVGEVWRAMASTLRDRD